MAAGTAGLARVRRLARAGSGLLSLLAGAEARGGPAHAGLRGAALGHTGAFGTAASPPERPHVTFGSISRLTRALARFSRCGCCVARAPLLGAAPPRRHGRAPRPCTPRVGPAAPLAAPVGGGARCRGLLRRRRRRQHPRALRSPAPRRSETRVRAPDAQLRICASRSASARSRLRPRRD